jgi:hypothetical protein
VKQRRELEKLIKRLVPGDTVVISKLDRLARSTLDLLQVVDQIGKADAGCRSLGDAWADTTTPHGKLMMTVLALNCLRRAGDQRSSTCSINGRTSSSALKLRSQPGHQPPL